jgi:acetyl-CoA acyltransferase
MAAQVFAVADAILKDVDAHLAAQNLNYRKLSLDAKLEVFLRLAANRMAAGLGVTFDTLRPHITDFIGFGPSIYEHHHTMDVAKKASFLGLTGVELHSVDLGGASTPAALELARKLCNSEDRLVLIAGSEVPRGGDAGVRYYREVSDALLDKNTEAHTQANLISLYALLADRLMFETGISIEDVHAITRYFRDRGVTNERAAMHARPLKEGELTRYLAGCYATAMVAVATDHGVAILVANDALLKRLQKQIPLKVSEALYISGAGTNYADKYLSRRRDFGSPGKLAAERAFARCALSPGDIDYAWIYDCFTLMLVRQAADYFGLAPASAARSLRSGYLQLGEKKIHVNQQGGILNTQAAISLSASTGLIDIFDYAARNPTAMNFLFGGNGGIDTVNAVALLTRKKIPYKKSVIPASVSAPLKSAPLREGETGILYASALVRFNPGADAPFILGSFRREDGSLCMARIADAGESAPLIPDKTRVVFHYRAEKALAFLRA